MGVIVQSAQSCQSLTACCSKQSVLSINSYEIVKTAQNGLAQITLENKQPALFINKRIPQLTYLKQKQMLLKWIKTQYKHSCNVLNFHIETDSLFCTSFVNLKLILEFGNSSIAQQLFFRSSRQDLGGSQIRWIEETSFNAIEALKLAKFLFECTEEHLKTTNSWINFHTSNILIFSEQDTFKYLHIPIFEEGHEYQIFFDPSNSDKAINACETQTIFGIGMVLLSYLLKQDCSECYNYQNFTFCQSIFQQKIERLQQITSKQNNTSEITSSDYTLTLQEQIADLIVAALSPTEIRPSFTQIKRKYYKLLRQMTISLDTDRCVSTKRNQSRSYWKDISLTNKRKVVKDDVRVQEFKANEKLKIQRLQSQIIQKESILKEVKCSANRTMIYKGKQNTAIKLKTKIRSRLAQQNKENLPFHQ